MQRGAGAVQHPVMTRWDTSGYAISPVFWLLAPMRDMLSVMAPKRRESDYVILPSVTHPGGRVKAFEDAFKAMV